MPDALECARCHTTNGVRPWKGFVAWRGSLFIPDTESGMTPLCTECQALRIQLNAMAGCDIHTHTINQACGPNCATQTEGRRLQYSWLLHADRRSGFLLTKCIDSMPRVNATSMRYTFRTGKFTGVRMPMNYYESLPGISDLTRSLSLVGEVVKRHVPSPAYPAFLLSFEVFEGVHTAPEGVIQFPRPGETSLGGHCVCPEGISEDGETIYFWNSWGARWGRNGYGSVSVEYVEKYLSDIGSVSNGQIGSSPYIGPPENLLITNASRGKWMTVNPKMSWIAHRVRGEKWIAEGFRTTSWTDGADLHIHQIRNGYGLRMGWVFVRHLPEQCVSRVEEIFVMPPFRRMGIGAFLESLACWSSRDRGIANMELVLWDCDSIVSGDAPVPRNRARLFGIAHGYDWKYGSAGRRGVYARGMKQLRISE